LATVVTDLWVANLFANFKASGACETYYLKAQDRTSAEAVAVELARTRALLLAQDCEIHLVTVRNGEYPAPARPCLQDPIGSLKKNNGSEYWGKLHTPHDALWWYFRAEDRKWSTRPIRFYQAVEVSANIWKRQGLLIPDVTPPRPLDPSSVPPELLYQHVLGKIRDITCHAERLPDVAGKPRWMLRDYQWVRFTKTGRRRVGARFWRVSWEPEVWTTGPDFSPCGTVVNAARRTYRQACRFYVDGAAKGIRFYTAAAAAKIIPFPTLFWPTAGYGFTLNTAGPGEIGRHRKTDWTPGFSVGNAPGLAPTGMPSRFLGFDSKPFDDSLPTPILLLPGCDMPVPPIRINNVPNTVNDPDTHWITVGTGLTLTHVGANHDRIDAVASPATIVVQVTPSTVIGAAIDTLRFNVLDVYDESNPSANIQFLSFGTGYGIFLGFTQNVTNLAIPKTRTVALANSLNTEIDGIANGWEGRELALHNITGHTIFLNHDATPGVNGIFCPNGIQYRIPHNDFAELVSTLAPAKWLVKPRIRTRTDFHTAPISRLTRFDGNTLLSDPAFALQPAPVNSTDVFTQFEASVGFGRTGGASLSGGVLTLPPGMFFLIPGPFTITDIESTHFGLRDVLLINSGTNAVDFVPGGSMVMPLFGADPVSGNCKLMPGKAVWAENTGEAAGVSTWNVWPIAGWGPPFRNTGQTAVGLPDGINLTFNFTSTPVGNVEVFVNGVLQVDPNDYTIAGTVITFAVASVPPAGAKIIVNYDAY
jgi:hypothetical protein